MWCSSHACPPEGLDVFSDRRMEALERRLIALSCAHLRDLKPCGIASQNMPELIMHPHPSLNTPALRHTLGLGLVYATATSADWKRTPSRPLHCAVVLTCSVAQLPSTWPIVQHHVRFSSQAKYWNSSVNEVEGTVTDQKGKVVHRLFGKWHEAVFCGDPPSATCIWRASTTGCCNSWAPKASFTMYVSILKHLMPWMLFVCNADAMPVDHEQYYGFTKFAVELNELDPSLKLLLPPTDTRLRVDQR